MEKGYKRLFSESQRASYAVGKVFNPTEVNAIEVLLPLREIKPSQNAKTCASKEDAGDCKPREVGKRIASLATDGVATAAVISLAILGVDHSVTKICQGLFPAIERLENRLSK